MFVERVRTAKGAGRLAEPVAVVLEGAACSGVEPGTSEGVTVLHVRGSGDDTIVAVIQAATSQVTLVTADRALRERAKAFGAQVASPGWLIEILEG